MNLSTPAGKKLFSDVFEVVHRSNSVTKNDIVQQLDTSSVTVHKTVTDLVSLGILSEAGSTSGGVGRRAIYYKINCTFGYFIGISLSTDEIILSAFDLLLNPILIKRNTCSAEYSDEFVCFLKSSIHKLIDEVPTEYGKCLGIGVSLPGIVNHRTNEIYTLFGIHGWNGVNLAELLKEEFNEIPINLDNDANGMMLAEKWKGTIQNIDSAVFLSITDGIGSAFLENNKIIYGQHSNFGEIGHISIDLNGRRCRCGNRGCLEAFAADSSLIRELQILYPEKNIKSIDDIVSLAASRDNGIYMILKRAAGYILNAMYIVFSGYDPGLLILGSTWLPHFPELFLEISSEMYQRFPWVNDRNLLMEIRDIKDMVPLSSGGIALENFYLNPPDVVEK